MGRTLFKLFVVRTDSKAKSDHWQGGPPVNAGATCSRCDQPLQLIWNIDGNDKALRTIFGRRRLDLDRIPLYFCFPCFSSLDYLILRNGSLKMLAVDGKPSDGIKKQSRPTDFPYENFPSQFPKQKIGLYAFDQFPKSLVKFVRSEPTKPLTKEMKTQIEMSFGVPVSKRLYDAIGLDWFQQFGGHDFLPQGDDHIVCMNENCKRYGNELAYLAGMSNYPSNGLPLVESVKRVEEDGGRFNSCVRFFFHVCRDCFSIHGESQGS